MVLVTVGTQKQQFRRLLQLVENAKELDQEQIVVQSGYTEFKSEKMQFIPFMKMEEFNAYIEKADMIITHGGVGSIFSALKAKKKILAVPRLHEFGEHVNDHQLEICKELQALGYIFYLEKEDNIDDRIKELRHANLKEYVSNLDFLDKLRKEI